MQGFKNLIARRRPSAATESRPQQTADLRLPTAVDEAATDVPQDVACSVDARQSARARAARAHVPRPDALAHKPFRPTMGESRMTSADPKAEAADPEPATPQARAPARKIWDIETKGTDETAQPAPAPRAAASKAAPGPDTANPILARCAEDPLAPSRAPRPAAGRAKTRLLGFHDDSGPGDVFAAEPVAATAEAPRFPIGWIVVAEGPGRGASFTLTTGLSTVGRDPDQTIALDFGDTAISRQNHVAIAHDDEENRTFVGHGGKSNIVRHNDTPLLTTETLADGDTIRIGKTVLRFVALCDETFSWAEQTDDGDA